VLLPLVLFVGDGFLVWTPSSEIVRQDGNGTVAGAAAACLFHASWW
jgi:hypothetical protein